MFGFVGAALAHSAFPIAIAVLAVSLPAAVQGQQQGSRDCAHCPEMVRVPPGSLLMGATPDEHKRQNVPALSGQFEMPQHRVTISYAFWLGKHEVTRGEFEAFVQAARHPAREWQSPPFKQTDRDPVVNVSWDDAKAYVAWLSLTTGKTYRLPAEAEWEYAARAGTTTARYWGDRFQDACRYANVDDIDHGCTDGYVQTAPVGKFQPNAFDAYAAVWDVAAAAQRVIARLAEQAIVAAPAIVADEGRGRGHATRERVAGKHVVAVAARGVAKDAVSVADENIIPAAASERVGTTTPGRRWSVLADVAQVEDGKGDRIADEGVVARAALEVIVAA